MTPLEPPRILVVEDDPDLGELLRYQFQHAGYAVELNPTGAGFFQQLQAFEPHLLVLDWMLPAADGLELLRQVRRQPRSARLPVILLTARGEEADRIRGLDIGADDYVTKPFSPRELLARVRARLRAGVEAGPAILQSGPLRLDLRAHQAELHGHSLELSQIEFRLLAFLMRNAGQAFTRRQIVDAVWAADHFITERTVDVYVFRLRGKLEADPDTPRWLQSVRRFGYSFAGEVVRA